MLNIGCHLSTAKGFLRMGQDASSIDANTFQFFTRNPRGSKAKKRDSKDINALIMWMQEHQFAAILGHAPYTLNPCSADPGIRELARDMMASDLENMEHLPHNYYNFHPGNHLGQGVEAGIEYITQLLNNVLEPEQSTLVLLETMSGKGSEVGSDFKEIKQIMDRVELDSKVGVCLDTCHVYSAGYDIVNDLKGVLEQFDAIIGLEKLYAIHLNDSLTPFASRKDRHARIGEGTIGFAAITGIINHPRLRGLPFFLETPNDVPGYQAEIKMLRAVFK